MEGFGPKRWWHGGLENKGANDVVCRADCTVGSTVLLGSIRAREVEETAMVEENTMEAWSWNPPCMCLPWLGLGWRWVLSVACANGKPCPWIEHSWVTASTAGTAAATSGRTNVTVPISVALY